MNNTITIAEVAAKLGLKAECLDYAGKVDGARFFLCDGSVGVVPRGGASWLRIGITALTPLQVCELAGVDYERYEGREPEQAPEPSAEQINAALLKHLKRAVDWCPACDCTGEVRSVPGPGVEPCPHCGDARAAIEQAEAAQAREAR